MFFWAEIHPYMWFTDKQRNGIPNNIQNEKSPAWAFKNIAPSAPRAAKNQGKRDQKPQSFPRH